MLPAGHWLTCDKRKNFPHPNQHSPLDYRLKREKHDYVVSRRVALRFAKLTARCPIRI
jgi:hypothetical protein